MAKLDLTIDELEEMLEIYNRRTVGGEENLRRTLQIIRRLKRAIAEEQSNPTPPPPPVP